MKKGKELLKKTIKTNLNEARPSWINNLKENTLMKNTLWLNNLIKRNLVDKLRCKNTEIRNSLRCGDKNLRIECQAVDLPGGAGGACRATSLTIFANKNRFYIMFLSTKIHARIFFVFEWMLYVHVNLCIHTYIFTYIYIYLHKCHRQNARWKHKCTRPRKPESHSSYLLRPKNKTRIGRVGVRGGWRKMT